MLKLRLNNTTASWIAVGGFGVRVLVPPCGTAVLRAAEYAGAQGYARAKAEMGVEDGDPLTPEQTGQLEGVYAEARIRDLVGRIQQWEGLAGEDDQPIPITPAALDAFAAHPALGRVFLAAYEAASVELVREGNVSGPSGGGKETAESNTADPVPAAA